MSGSGDVFLILSSKYTMMKIKKIWRNAMAMEWKDLYSCQIPEIDQQHRRLFELGNQLYTLALRTDAQEHHKIIKAILTELHAYTVYHFEFEEALLVTYGYPNLEEHRKKHQFFIKKLSVFEIDLFHQDVKEMLLKLILFVSEWISSHIMIEDKKYGRYIGQSEGTSNS